MGLRFGLIFLLLVGAAWDCHARTLGSSDSPAEASGDRKVCKLCESYVSQAIDYFSEKKTQTEIIASLRRSCSLLGPMKEECISAVEQYVPLFFAEVSSIEPENFCRSIHFCKKISTVSSRVQENSCGFCRQTVSDVLVKVKDPDTQVEIMEMLLETCSSMGDHLKARCKGLVFEYGPLILANSEKFLEKTDICTLIRACGPEASGEMATSSVGTVPVLADS